MDDIFLFVPWLYLDLVHAMLHSIVIAVYLPVQMIIIPLKCNRSIPNITNRGIVILLMNQWMFLGFSLPFTKYSYYRIITFFHQIFCSCVMVRFDWILDVHNIFDPFELYLAFLVILVLLSTMLEEVI